MRPRPSELLVSPAGAALRRAAHRHDFLHLCRHRYAGQCDQRILHINRFRVSSVSEAPSCLDTQFDLFIRETLSKLIDPHPKTFDFWAQYSDLFLLCVCDRRLGRSRCRRTLRSTGTTTSRPFRRLFCSSSGQIFLLVNTQGDTEARTG